MKKLQLIMEKVGPVRATIEKDLSRYEAGERGGFRFMEYVPDEGMYVPHNWIKNFPEWEEKWNKFMDGQTVCMAGVFYRDVQRFLGVLERNAQQAEQKEG